MKTDVLSDLLVEVTVEHLPQIRWFKNNWMDFVIEMNDRGDCTHFSITYHESENNLDIEWNGRELFFSQDESSLAFSAPIAQNILALLKKCGRTLPEEIMEFVSLRLTVSA